MSISKNGFVQIFKDNGCRDEIIDDIVKCNIDDMISGGKNGSNFWLPMTYELSSVYEKSKKYLIEVLNWIVPVCGHPVRSIEQQYDLIFRTDGELNEYTPDMFIEGAAFEAVAHGFFHHEPIRELKIPGCEVPDKAYSTFLEFVKSGSSSISNTSVSKIAYGDKFHIDQADRILDIWTKIGIVDRVSGRDERRYLNACSRDVAYIMEINDTKFNTFSMLWCQSVRRAWLKKLAEQLITDSKNGKLFLSMEQVKRSIPIPKYMGVPEIKKKLVIEIKKDAVPDIKKEALPEIKKETVPEVGKDNTEAQESVKVEEPASTETDWEPIDDEETSGINIYEKLEENTMSITKDENPREDSFETAITILETVIQRYSEGYHASAEGRRKLATMVESAAYLMER